MLAFPWLCSSFLTLRLPMRFKELPVLFFGSIPLVQQQTSSRQTLSQLEFYYFNYVMSCANLNSSSSIVLAFRTFFWMRNTPVNRPRALRTLNSGWLQYYKHQCNTYR
jgi:hypothetical protein